jgi:hypothetical protein
VTSRTRAVAKVTLGVGTGVLLLSQGGVFIVVPLLLPAHLWAARTSNRAGRLLWTLLPSLGLASVAWATIYLTVGEDRPTIWLVPLLTLGASWAGLARVACQGATV